MNEILMVSRVPAGFPLPWWDFIHELREEPLGAYANLSQPYVAREHCGYHQTWLETSVSDMGTYSKIIGTYRNIPYK